MHNIAGSSSFVTSTYHHHKPFLSNCHLLYYFHSKFLHFSALLHAVCSVLLHFDLILLFNLCAGNIVSESLIIQVSSQSDRCKIM